MRQAEGFHMGTSNQVCLLRKSLYGLKQAARQWNKKLHVTLAAMGFKRLESDRSIYIFLRDEVRIIIPVFIDDIMFASSNSNAIDSTVKELASHFKLRDLGPTSFLLGIEITHNLKKHQIALSQRQYSMRLSGLTCPISIQLAPPWIQEHTFHHPCHHNHQMSKKRCKTFLTSMLLVPCNT